MTEFASPTYQCPACGTDFPWRPESAGRSVHCTCSAILVIPFSPGVADRTDHPTRSRPAPSLVREPPAAHSPPSEIPLTPEAPVSADDGACPECHAPMRIGAVVCTQCGFRRRRAKQRLVRRSTQDETPAPAPSGPSPIPPLQAMGLSKFWDVILPGCLAGVGLILEVILLAQAFRSPGYGWVDALACTPFLILLAVGTVATVFLCELVLLPIFDLSLGPLEPLVPKLAAAVIFPAAVGALIQVGLNNNATGIAVGWLSSAVLYLLFFRLLFDFEWPDAIVLISCVCLAHAAVLFLVLWPLTHGPLPLPDLWRVFGAIIFQSLATFTIAGALIVPHFRRQ